MFPHMDALLLAYYTVPSQSSPQCALTPATQYCGGGFVFVTSVSQGKQAALAGRGSYR